MKPVFIQSSLHLSKKNTPDWKWVTEYLKFPVPSYERLLSSKLAEYWELAGQKRALEIFHTAANRVPAYKDFLKKHRISAEKIKSIEDFAFVPPTDKINYIQAYPIAARSLQGKITFAKIIAASSGTSGSPNYWPRNTYQEFEAAITHELLYRTLFSLHTRSTLFIIGFPMGVYVSGIATALPSWLVTQKYNATIATAGNNKTEILKLVKTLGKNFDQTILIGHPFFLKDVLETGTAEGIIWKDYNPGLLFCSEGFSEAWREYVLAEAGIADCRAFNTYGSSEFLLMAYETPESIRIRKLMETNPSLLLALTGDKVTPNIFQYNPTLRYMETLEHELICTAAAGIPLVRFNMHDNGSIISPAAIPAETQQYPKHKSMATAWQLPYVTVTGRSDYALVFYAANIYPQHIHIALHHRDLFKKITGKFTLTKGYTRTMEEYLEIHIELKPNTKNSKKLSQFLTHRITQTLLDMNAEYLFLQQNLHADLTPRVKLWEYHHDRYFKQGLKPKYIQ